MAHTHARFVVSFLLVLAVGAAACGGGEDDGGGGSDCTAGSVVQVTATTGSPACLAVAPGGVVTFRNVGASALEIRSGPHPTHGSCPELDATPSLPAGGETTVTMTTLGDCRYHDHLSNTGTALGTIRVGASSASGGGGGVDY